MTSNSPEMRALRKLRQPIIEREKSWHENEAVKRHNLDRLLYGPPAFEHLVLSGFSFLNLEPGSLLLDMACGEGKETLSFALQGMRVMSVDLSHSQLVRTRQLIEQHNVAANVYFIQANVELLPFSRNALPAVYGKAILHHLDLDIAQQEMARVLSHNGRATFAEPLSGHPLFRLARRFTPRLRTMDEHPLTYTELHCFAASFAASQTREAFLVAPLAYVLRLFPGFEKVFQLAHLALRRLDEALFRNLPGLRRFAWYGMVDVQNTERPQREVSR